MKYTAGATLTGLVTTSERWRERERGRRRLKKGENDGFSPLALRSLMHHSSLESSRLEHTTQPSSCSSFYSLSSLMHSLLPLFHTAHSLTCPLPFLPTSRCSLPYDPNVSFSSIHSLPVSLVNSASHPLSHPPFFFHSLLFHHITFPPPFLPPLPTTFISTLASHRMMREREREVQRRAPMRIVRE